MGIIYFKDKGICVCVERDCVLVVSLTECYEEFSIASALVWGQGEDTSHIISVWRFLLLPTQQTNQLISFHY